VLTIKAFCGHDEVVKYLIGKGGNIEATDDDEMTPLHKAAEQNRLSTVRILLELGAKTDVKTKKGLTPMELATSSDVKDLFKKYY
jgi:ankyrin repeat protein